MFLYKSAHDSDWVDLVDLSELVVLVGAFQALCATLAQKD